MTGPEVRIAVEPPGEDVLRFYAEAGLDRGLAGPEAIAWAFGSNPHPFCVARTEAGPVVGLSSYVRTRFRFGEATGTALQAVDSFVSPAMRGRGLFPALARAYAAHAAGTDAALIWGFPNDNAAPVWFGKLGWADLGQVPLLVKPLRSGILLRKLGLDLDLPLAGGRDQGLAAAAAIGPWADELWERQAAGIGCGAVRDAAFLRHRLLGGPQAAEYRVVADARPDGALLATREARKHGGRIAYVMEALGGPSLEPLLRSELARLRDRGTELALAWSFPWSPGHRTLRRCGFLPLPGRLRPIRIWFGASPLSGAAAMARDKRNWYLSYLDSDTV